MAYYHIINNMENKVKTPMEPTRAIIIASPKEDVNEMPAPKIIRHAIAVIGF